MSTPATADAPASPATCPHIPPCPAATAPDAQAARILVNHHKQGWTLRCNGLIMVDGTPLTGPVR